jgi:hypothetical protein
MAENEQTKVCPLCAETIKAAAKVCPYCRKSQRRWVFMTRYDIVAIVIVLLLPITFFLFTKIFYQGRDFSLDKDKIRVLDFHFAINKNYETNVVVLGVLTNESEHSWNINHVDIRYLNREGKVMDMDDYAYGVVFTILPHSVDAFRLTLDERKSVPQYEQCEVKVASAEDPATRWDIFGN